jgi:DNA-binding transcriptional regulator PaaX
MEIIRIKGLPECFCGFQASQLFLCTHEEVAATAWDWEEIGLRHQNYLQRLTGTETELRDASTLSELATVARRERQAYQYAFSFDPLLPRVLLPKLYAGIRVEEQHQTFRRRLACRMEELTAA